MRIGSILQILCRVRIRLAATTYIETGNSSGEEALAMRK